MLDWLYIKYISFRLKYWLKTLPTPIEEKECLYLTNPREWYKQIINKGEN